MHGKPSTIRWRGGRLLSGLPERFEAGRYHSLFGERDTLPECLEVTADTEDGVVMAIEHRTLPVAAVQFHPESILTLGGEVGRRLIHEVVARLQPGGNATARAPRRELTRFDTPPGGGPPRKRGQSEISGAAKRAGNLTLTPFSLGSRHRTGKTHSDPIFARTAGFLARGNLGGLRPARGRDGRAPGTSTTPERHGSALRTCLTKP